MLSALSEELGISSWRAVGFNDSGMRNLEWSGDYAGVQSLFEEERSMDSRFNTLEFQASDGPSISIEVMGGAARLASPRVIGHKVSVEVDDCGASAESVGRAVFRSIVKAWDPVVVVLTDASLGGLEDVKRFWRVRPGYVVWTNDLLNPIQYFDESVVRVERLGGGSLMSVDPSLSAERTFEVVMGVYEANGIWDLPREPVQSMDVPSRGEIPEAVDVDGGQPLADVAGEEEWVDPAVLYQQQVSGWLPDGQGNVPLWVQPESSMQIPVHFIGHTKRGETEVFLHAFYGDERFGEIGDDLAVLEAPTMLSIASWQLSVLPEGAVLEWHVSSSAAATGLRNFFAIHGLSGIRVVHTPEVSADE